MRLITLYKTFIPLAFGLFALTSCGTFCAACSSVIENKSHSDIYVIVKYKTETFNIKTTKYFAERSHISNYHLDSVKNTGVFVIPPGGHLETYDGPGNNPARPLNNLRIITNKKIYDYPTQNDINDAWDKTGVLYTLTIN